MISDKIQYTGRQIIFPFSDGNFFAGVAPLFRIFGQFSRFPNFHLRFSLNPTRAHFLLNLSRSASTPSFLFSTLVAFSLETISQVEKV